MSKRQTAVEWLIDELNEIGIRYLDLAEEQINKAIQLEREQIEEAYVDGMEFIPVAPNKYKSDAEHYYTQTYGECTKQ